MKRVILKNTNLEISNICLGTDHYGGKISEETAFRILDRFMNMGGNILDTANVYGKWLPAGENASEQVIGKWIKSRNVSDERMLVCTKGGHYDLGNPSVSRITEADIKADLEESLLSLHRDHVDIYWLHRDRVEVPAGELLEWLEKLVGEGKIRYYGASNFTRKRMDEAAAFAKAHGLTGFIGLQNRWSLASPNPGPASWDTLRSMDEEFYAWHVSTGTPLFPYTSSAHGYFAKAAAGNVPREMQEQYDNERNRRVLALLQEDAVETGLSPFVLAQAFLLSQPFQVIPLMTARVPEQLDDFALASNFALSPERVRQYLNPEFFPTDDLKSEEICLRLDHANGAKPEKGWVPSYYFDICLPDGTKIGTCDLRIGHNRKTYIGGNIGYRIEEAFRGHRYAAKACLLLFKQAKKHGLDHLYITCDPSNTASSRTCEIAGGQYIETAPIPEDNEMYAEGKRQVMIYRFDLG